MSRKFAFVIGALLIAAAIYMFLRQPSGDVAAPSDVAPEAVATPVETSEASPELPGPASTTSGSSVPAPATQPGLVAGDVEEAVSEDTRGRPEQVVSVSLPIRAAPPTTGAAPEVPSETMTEEMRAIADAAASIDNTGPQQQFPGPGEEALSRAGEEAIQVPGENRLGPGAAPEAFGEGATYAAPEADNVITDTSAPESGDRN